MITWPDLKLPPINLYNAPYLKVRVERQEGGRQRRRLCLLRHQVQQARLRALLAMR